MMMEAPSVKELGERQQATASTRRNDHRTKITHQERAACPPSPASSVLIAVDRVEGRRR
jgi:hypothetical protein